MSREARAATRPYVYRLVVDKWPTPNERPFADQTIEFWEKVIEDHAKGDGPAWLPVDLSSYRQGLQPAKYTRWFGEEGEPDVGWSASTLICVPIAPTRRFFTRSTVVSMCEQLREWGCRAHIERAAVSDWEEERGA